MPRALLALLVLLGGGAPFLVPSGMALFRTVAAATADAGNIYDPDGQPGTNAGGNWDPDGQAETDAGNNYDPNG